MVIQVVLVVERDVVFLKRSNLSEDVAKWMGKNDNVILDIVH
jgi:hypothetical protein